MCRGIIILITLTMEIVSMSYVLGLLGLVSLVILGFLFVVYCHETGLKLNPKLSSEGWWRVVWSFLQSLWRSEKEIIELKLEVKNSIKYIQSNDYYGEGLCRISSRRKLLPTLLGIYSETNAGYWWPPAFLNGNKKEAARPRILYLEFLLKNIHLVHELLKLNEKISNGESLSVSELEGLKQRHTFLKSFLSPTQIK